MQRYITYNLTRLKQIVSPDVNIIPLPESVTFNMDVPIKMRDGKTLYANIFLPTNLTPESPKLPVIMSAHPYSKDAFSKRGLIINHYDLHYRALRMPSTVTFSEFTSWEAPDPAYWVPHGYAVINLDLRGFHKSKEAATLAHPVMFSDQEAQDYYDAIEWAAEQEWCNGKVGLLGVSYLAISQYKVAALRPPHLCAICPWEGFTDMYRDTARPGGIAETQFFKAWFTQLKSFMSEDLPLEILANETRNSEFYLGKTCDLKRIDVPALVVMSYSDQGLHTQGSMRAFRKIGSKEKWLYTHRTGKWVSFYSPESLQLQLKFFDYFLKTDAKHNGMNQVPRVSIEVRSSGDYIHKVLTFDEPIYPVKTTKWTRFNLKENGMLSPVPSDTYISLSDVSLNTTTTTIPSPFKSKLIKLDSKQGHISFTYKFDENTIVSGPMKLYLNVSSSNLTDMNLFAYIRKYDCNLDEVYFEGAFGYGLDCVTKGWQRVALRKIVKLEEENNNDGDESWCSDNKPFDTIEPLETNKCVQLVIDMMPSSTLFEKNSSLILFLQGMWMHPTMPLISACNFEASKQSGQLDVHLDDEKSYLVLGIL